MARCDTYDRGECTWGACRFAGWVPEGLGNSNQWCERAAGRGLSVTFEVSLNAVVCFRPGGLYHPEFGHVAVVTQIFDRHHFLVKEMNYQRFNEYDDRRTDDGWILGFIAQPGTAPGSGIPQLPPANLAPLDELGAAWASVQDYWNSQVEQHVFGVQYVGSLMVGISNS